MHRDQVVAPDKEVDVARRKRARTFLAVDAVQDKIEELGILLDLRKLERTACVLDRERMEMKDVVQQLELGVGGRRQIHPELYRRGRVEPARLDLVRQSGGAALVYVN